MSELEYGDFEKWQDNHIEDLRLNFIECTPEREQEFEDFCWEAFESHRQGPDTDAEYERQRDDKMFAEENGKK